MVKQTCTMRSSAMANRKSESVRATLKMSDGYRKSYGMIIVPSQPEFEFSD